jgi:hypothetical protein
MKSEGTLQGDGSEYFGLFKADESEKIISVPETVNAVH